MSKTNEVILKVIMDEENYPSEIYWKSDNQQQDWEKCKAFLLSLFEDKSKSTLKLDLWTKDFQLEEMNQFMYYTLFSLCETYMKATQNQKLANQFMSFVNFFGEENHIIERKLS